MELERGAVERSRFTIMMSVGKKECEVMVSTWRPVNEQRTARVY
jgi:hypothetical protein